MGREKYENLTQRRSGSQRTKATEAKGTLKNTNGESRQATCLQRLCGVQYFPIDEKLEYDYSLDESKGKNVRSTQALPRIRQRGEPYVDSFNDEPWKLSYGTSEEVRHFTLLSQR